ncbi:MAG: RepB family plasmid replication initiator protein [Thiovulaceae bacterium]|nr:RepB family plasmid replication initiator protein [Sulfurimonadaceae bacterium]
MSNIETNKKIALLDKAKKQHFDFLKKNNAITDAKNGELSLGAMKALDVILQVYEDTQETKMQLELSYLRKKLGLVNNNDYVDRIKNYLLELKLPFELRDFNDLKTGKKVLWALTSFLNDVKSFKDSQHLVEINISENFVEYMIEKAGYTKIDLTLSKKFKTKYGYKIYEMYLRYYSMPNKIDRRLGTIKKDMNELNAKFGTNHKHASKLLEGIHRGLKEINIITAEEIYCIFDKAHRQFIFSWAKDLEKVESKCMIPSARIDEFIDWLILHSKNKINDSELYKRKLKNLIINNELEEWEESYRGMLIYKYGYSSNEIDDFKTVMGKYKDFYKTKEQSSLF